MRPGTRTTIPTVEEAVQAAAATCDPEGTDRAVTSLIESFEGDERPATSVDDLRGELVSAAAELDPDQGEPAVSVAAATAHWIATNPDADGEVAIREGVRVAYGDEVPPAVSDWLSSRGIG